MNDTPSPAEIAYEAWVRSKEHPPMSETPTPGQVAYAAYWRTLAPQFGPAYMHPWADNHPQNQAAWEAAAAAVREHWTPQEDRR